MASSSSTYFISTAIILFVSAATAMPISHTTERTQCINCTQAIEALHDGYLVFRDIARPLNMTGTLIKLLTSSIKNETGISFLCDVLRNEDIIPDCWRDELDYFCFEFNSFMLLHKAFQSMAGVTCPTTSCQCRWLNNQLDPEAKELMSQFVSCS